MTGPHDDQTETPGSREVDREVLDDVMYDDLVGVFEVAQNLNVSIHRVKRWIERRASTNCPRPVRRLRLGHIYSMTDWRGWFALWRITRGSETWLRRPDDRP